MSTTPEADALLARLSAPTGSTGTADLEARMGHARSRLDTAIRLMDRGHKVPDDTRLRGVKQALATGLRPVVAPQAHYNAAITDAVMTLAEVLDSLVSERRETDRLAAAVESLGDTIETFGLIVQRDDALARAAYVPGADQPTIEHLIETVHHLSAELTRLVGSEPAHGDEALQEIRARLAVIQARQNLMAARDHHAADGDAPDEMPASSDASDRLYEEFEDRFRGTAEYVRNMLVGYLDDVAATPIDGPVVDIGCGRGEWLAMLREAGVDAYGLDRNDVAIGRCHAQGLDARNADIIDHLSGVAEGSLRAVTSFHVVEHLPFAETVALIDAALVALAPGGLLILETPNPTNLGVGAAFFWIDPTHLRPMHPLLLEFVVENRGFTDIEVRYLHRRDDVGLDPSHLVNPLPEGEADTENPAAGAARTGTAIERLDEMVFGHLDYAVVARKPGSTT